MNYWLIKSEPDKYSWQNFLEDGRTFWDGVRNYQARNNLKAMKVGDQVLFYHSGDERSAIGIAKVAKEYYQDPTTDDANWVVVDLEPIAALKKAVSLETIKADKRLQDMLLIKQARLSVVPVKKEEFDCILELGA